MLHAGGAVGVSRHGLRGLAAGDIDVKDVSARLRRRHGSRMSGQPDETMLVTAAETPVPRRGLRAASRPRSWHAAR